MALFDFLFGSQEKLKKVPTVTQDQQRIFQQLLNMLSPQGGLGGAYGESTDLLRQYLDPSSEAAQRFTDPYMREYEQQTVPGLAERFAGLGAMGGGLQSSGFGQALGASGANLQSQLAALRASLGQQAASQIGGQFQGLQGQGLGFRPFGYEKVGGSAGLLPSLLGGYLQAGLPGFGSLYQSPGSGMAAKGALGPFGK